ncbi:MAG TPA: hypothetical protein VGO93_00665 [Candidatus Xenobia bacterium]|jgi:hypothetical protein
MFPGQNPSMPGAAAAAPAQSPAMQAYNDAAKALNIQCQGDNFVYLMELKKLVLAIIQSEEVTRTLQERHEKFDGGVILRQELQNQLLSFAIMRVLDPDKVKAATKSANQHYMDGLVQTPPLSPAGMMLKELEQTVGESEEVGKRVQEELMLQPLFRIVSKSPEAFGALERTYMELGSSAQSLLRSINQSLGLVVKSQANPAPATSSFGPTPP